MGKITKYGVDEQTSTPHKKERPRSKITQKDIERILKKARENFPNFDNAIQKELEEIANSEDLTISELRARLRLKLINKQVHELLYFNRKNRR